MTSISEQLVTGTLEAMERIGFRLGETKDDTMYSQVVFERGVQRVIFTTDVREEELTIHVNDGTSQRNTDLRRCAVDRLGLVRSDLVEFDVHVRVDNEREVARWIEARKDAIVELLSDSKLWLPG